MIAVDHSWKTIPDYAGATVRRVEVPAGTRARAASVERYLRKLANHAPLSSTRLYALMCIADRDAAASGMVLSGLEWGYFGWAPVPVGPYREVASRARSLRPTLQRRRILRTVWAEWGSLPIEELQHVANRALDDLRLTGHGHSTAGA